MEQSCDARTALQGCFYCAFLRSSHRFIILHSEKEVKEQNSLLENSHFL